MIRKYLLNYEQELLEKKIDLSKALQKNEISLKENTEFIRFLESSEDKSYDSFAPHNYKNDMNAKRMKELKENQKKLIAEGERIKDEIDNISKKIMELEQIIQIEQQAVEKSESIEKQLEDNGKFRLKLLETQEYERQRIARELHDSTVQSLTGMIHRIELCSKLMDMDPNRCKLELQNMTKTIRETIRDMREMIYDLRPMSLDDIGIDVTIEQELDKLRMNYDIQITCNTYGSSEGILPVVALTMLRIIQEACNNTIKYANAKNIVIDIRYGDDQIDLDISDDGIGFDIEEARNANRLTNNGFGLSIMYERVFLLFGTINIESTKDKGTKIHISIPKKEENKDVG